MKMTFATFAVFALAFTLVLVLPAAARGPTIKSIVDGDHVFLYEQGLNLAGLEDGAGPVTALRKFVDDDPGKAIVREISVGDDSSFTVDPDVVAGVYGVYYPVNGVLAGSDKADRSRSITIEATDLSLGVYLNDHLSSVDGKSITQATPIDFKIVAPDFGAYYRTASVAPGQVDIEVTTPDGGTLTVFGNNGVSLASINVTGSSFFTNDIDLTGVTAGTYTAVMKFSPGQDFSGQASTDSNPVSFSVISKALTLTSNTESVVAGHDFVVTITGQSNKNYYVYIRGGSSSGYPLLLTGQPDVNDTAAAQSEITSFATDAAGVDGTLAIVTTDASGTRTVEFDTTSVTDTPQFTIRVVDPLDRSTYETANVAVQEGQVTFTTSGTGVFYLGDVITLSGTSTSGDYVYLFLTGPNLNSNGLKLDDAVTAVTDGDPSTFTVVGVNTDGTWSYKWDTSSLGRTLDTGAYTIYAIDSPYGRNSLDDHQYQTVSVVLEKGFLTANTVANTVAAGDNLVVSGTAAGASEVYVWIFGPNYQNLFNSVTVQDDTTFSYTINNIDLFSGQYYVFVQNPLGSGPGVTGSDANGNECSGPNCYGMAGSTFGNVRLSGLPASQAAAALRSELDSPYFDDTYTTTTFTIASPYLALDPITDLYTVQNLNVHGTTNLATGDQIQVTVGSLGFTPTTKGQANEFSAGAATVAVYQGNSSAYNEFNASFDISAFIPGAYTVDAQSINTGTETSENFNVLAGVPPTPTPTPTPLPTTPPTTVPTTIPTTVPTTTRTPGFDMIIALVGIGAVAVLAARRRG